MNTEALDAAIHCHDFRKAAQILSVVDDEKIIHDYGHRLAEYFQDRDELTVRSTFHFIHILTTLISFF